VADKDELDRSAKSVSGVYFWPDAGNSLHMAACSADGERACDHVVMRDYVTRPGAYDRLRVRYRNDAFVLGERYRRFRQQLGRGGGAVMAFLNDLVPAG